ncbi:hypothetical protein LWI29_028280 [Acer saccharum]|uniref:Uncharacterized protein n=1 Tax=Acer saccharum TaxID=4024 RepID=A0AA39VYD9_ACESA|nr:hypothetical protein LWI29_028280 [Acer saccharum]
MDKDKGQLMGDKKVTTKNTDIKLMKANGRGVNSLVGKAVFNGPADIKGLVFGLTGKAGIEAGGIESKESCQHSNPSFAKFLLRRRHYPISAANLPTDTIVVSPSVRCSSTRNGVIVEATKAARSSDPVRMGSSTAEATTGRSKAAATVAVRWWRLWQQGRSEKFFSSSGRCP